MTSETFEQVLTAAQADGSFNPAWKKFVNTKFFVPIVHADNDPKKFSIHTAPSQVDGTQAVLISEVRERLGQHGTGVAALTGADVVRLLHAEAGILIALSDRAFSIARERVEWLKKGVEAAQARAAAKTQQAPVTVAAPFPTLTPASIPDAPARAPAPAPAPAVPLSLEKIAPAPAAAAPGRRSQGGVLDVAALKPRSAGMPEFGLEFFVPADWREARSAKVLRFADEVKGTKVEVSGVHRENVSVHQWLGMRQSVVQHEMRYLTQDGEAYALDGEGWRDRVKGMAVEYAGTVPGEDVESRYLLACIRIDGTMVSFGIRAPAKVFEEQRSLYKWLISRVDLIAAPVQAGGGYRDPNTGAAAGLDNFDATQSPAMFGLSLEGRIGRLRALAYSLPAVVPFAALTGLSALVFPFSVFLGASMAIVGSLLMAWFSLRLMVLRLHDINRSGKWILLFVVFIVLAGITRKPILFAVLSVVFWLGTLLVYYILPGTDGDNEYGPPPSENTTLIQAGAALFCLFQLVMIGAQVKMLASPQGYQSLDFTSSRIPGPDEAGVPFSPPDNSFVVDLPDEPDEVVLPEMQQMSQVEIHQFQLQQGKREYVVQAIDYGEAPDDRYAAMNGLQKAVVAEDGVLAEAKPFMFNNGVIGREVRVNLKGGMVRVARFALVGSKLCVVIIAAPRGEAADAHINAVFKTFQLL